jgi:hypothetical protein
MEMPAEYVGTGIRLLRGVNTWIVRDENVFDELQVVLHEKKKLSKFGCKINANSNWSKTLRAGLMQIGPI